MHPEHARTIQSVCDCKCSILLSQQGPFSTQLFLSKSQKRYYTTHLTSEESEGRLHGRRRWNLNAGTHIYIFMHLYYMDNTEIHAYNKHFHRSQQHNHLLYSLGNSKTTDKGCLLSRFILCRAGFMVLQSRDHIICFIYYFLVLFFTPRHN